MLDQKPSALPVKKIIIVAAILAILISAYILSGALGHKDTQQAVAATAEQAAAPAMAVSTLTIQPQTISLKKELPGRITAYRQSQVRPQVDGIIVERLFQEGSNVEKGDQLYQIDDARYVAALNSAKADLKSAQANIKSIESQANRYDKLVKIDAVSAQEYDDIKAELDQAKAAIAVAKAAVDVAQVNLDYTKVYAPISGRISRSFVTEGTLATANQTQQLATITQLDPIYIDMQQAGEEALQFRASMAEQGSVPVRIVYGEAQDQLYPHEGILKFSEVTVDETTGSITLRAQIPNEDQLLLPGLFVRAQLDLGEREALLVPQRATARSADGSLSIWVVGQDNKAQKRALEIEQAHGNQWVVTAGVEDGDQIIVEGYQKLAEGQAVSPSVWIDSAKTAE